MDTTTTQGEAGTVGPPVVAGYVAMCGTCGGCWGAVTNGRMPALDVAAFVATMIADGAVVLAKADAEEIRRDFARECACPKSGPTHDAPTEGAPGCPGCGMPSFELKKRNTCRDCGTRYTLERALTLYAVRQHGRAPARS